VVEAVEHRSYISAPTCSVREGTSVACVANTRAIKIANKIANKILELEMGKGAPYPLTVDDLKRHLTERGLHLHLVHMVGYSVWRLVSVTSRVCKDTGRCYRVGVTRETVISRERRVGDS